MTMMKTQTSTKNSNNVILPRPFIKWAGGKTQLLPHIRAFYPFSDNMFDTYIEPFVGGGSVLFDVLTHYPNLRRYIINDRNPCLVNTYRAIQLIPEDVYNILIQMQDEFYSLDTQLNKIEYYLSKRKQFNQLKLSTELNLDAPHSLLASLFIFLNKTCYNGLYRENSKGEFNVPLGTYAKPRICDDNLFEIARSLKQVYITCGDYSSCLDMIDSHSFVYIDPPYRPISKTSQFTKYLAHGFSDADQIALSKFVVEIDKRSALFLLSNSCDMSDHNKFLTDLYPDYYVTYVRAKRNINSNAQQRNSILEMLVSNREVISNKEVV